MNFVKRLSGVARLAGLVVAIAIVAPVTPSTSTAAARDTECCHFPDKNTKKPTGKKSKKKSAKSATKKSSKKQVVRWGKRANETDAKYDKRYKRVLKKIKFDKDGNIEGGPERLWTYMGHPFIVRTDIGPEFTADSVMYMEMLHREYGAAYKKLLGNEPAQVKEAIEVIIFQSRATYTKNGGGAGSGGQFMTHFSFPDRGPFWPALHYRLMQFTDGIDDFAKWPKGVLKHEAAHMEMRLRLGMSFIPQLQLAVPVDCPRWFDEGQASVFEYWDFDKTADENLALIPDRGRYAPVIRRIHKTDRWKEFKYVWEIDPSTWHADMTSDQGFLNYAQAWSLAAYMMHGGVKGRKDFRAIYLLSKRVGADRQTTYKGDGLRAWEDQFPLDARNKMEASWNSWVGDNVPRNKKVADEDYMLLRMGYNPKITDKLEGYSEEELADILKEVKKERERRKKKQTVEK